MPQVASLSDHHILISKEVKGNRTYAHMKELSLEEKIRQVAYLISGGNVTEKQLDYAKEMVLASGTDHTNPLQKGFLFVESRSF